MDQVEFALMVEEGKGPQPAKEFVSVGRGQDVPEGVSMLGSGNAFGHSKKMKVMVSKDADRRVTEGSYGSERFKGFRSAVHKVTGEPQLIL